MQVCMPARWCSAPGISRKGVPKSTVPSLRVHCHSQPRGNADAKIQEPRGVFQMTPQRGEATLYDARCFVAHGCTPSVIYAKFLRSVWLAKIEPLKAFP